jgi:hypothetical protein
MLMVPDCQAKSHRHHSALPTTSSPFAPRPCEGLITVEPRRGQRGGQPAELKAAVKSKLVALGILLMHLAAGRRCVTRLVQVLGLAHE